MNTNEEEKDYYELLGLDEEDKDLPWDDFEKKLKKEFRKLSLQYHPDKMSGKSDDEKNDAEEKFKDITEAYNVLSDRQKKQEYDAKQDMKSQFGFDGNNPWADMMRREQESMRMAALKGDDVLTSVYLTIEEIYSGVENKEVVYNIGVKCPDCNGTGSSNGKEHICPHCGGRGFVETSGSYGNVFFRNQSVCTHCQGTGRIIKDKCKKCHGTGTISEKRTININFPPGLSNGMRIRQDGFGGEPKGHGGQYGDLYIDIHEVQNPNFKRDGNNLLFNKEITLKEAWLGCDVDVMTPDKSKYRIHIPPMSKSGAQFSLKGKGFMDYRRGYRGNIIVSVSYALPKKNRLTDRQKELLNEFYEIENKK